VRDLTRYTDSIEVLAMEVVVTGVFTSPAVLDVVQSHATTRVPELPPIGKFEDVSFGQLESWYSSGMRVSSSFCVCKPGFKPSLLVAAENKKRSRFERLRKPKTSAAPSEGPITDMSFQDLQRLNDMPSGILLPVLVHHLNISCLVRSADR